MSYQTLQDISQYGIFLATLLTAMASLGAYVFGRKAQQKNLQTISHFVIAFGVVLGGLGIFGAYYFDQKTQQEQTAQQADTGILETKGKLVLSGKQQLFPKLQFGDADAMVAGNIYILFSKLAGDNGLTVEIEDGQIKVSTVIRDRNGNIIAEVTKNEWQLNPNNYFERNYSKDALEVKDNSGDVVFQIRLVEDIAQLQFKLYDSTGQGLSFGKIQDSSGRWGGIFEITNPSHPELTLKIQPLFKYPSTLHLGEFINGKAH